MPEGRGDPTKERKGERDKQKKERERQRMGGSWIGMGGIKDIWWLVSEVREIWGLGGFDEEIQAAGCVQQPNAHSCNQR